MTMTPSPAAAGTEDSQPTSDATPAAGSASEDPVRGRPSFTITEAATACAVSRKTITRKLAELAEVGAAKDADGIWRIPVEALLSVGLHPGRSVVTGSPRREPVVDLRATAPRPAVEAPPLADTVTVPRDRWDDLRIRLARAEAESVERGRALEDARLALRALTAGPSVQTPAAVPAAEVVAGPPVAVMPPTESQYEVPEPVAGLPPTPVPQSLAADSSVWDTLLPRAGAAPAGHTAASADPSVAMVGGLGVQPPTGPSPYQPTQHITMAEPPPAGQVVTVPRRRWWGGKR